jgi:hypothetical protein
MNAWRNVCGPTLGDPGAPGDPAHDPPSGVAVEPLAVGLDEDRAVAAFTDGEVGRPSTRGLSGTVAVLPPLRSTSWVR